MKKLFLLSAACLAVVAPKAADAFLADLNPLGNAGYYASINAGPNWVSHNRSHNHGSFSGSGRRSHDNNNVGYYVAGTLGMRTCYGLRFEGEVAYRNNQHKRRDHRGSGDFSGSYSGSNHHRNNLSSTALMFNGLYDLDLCWAVKPYGGFGIGYAWTQTPRNNNYYDFSGSGSKTGRHHKRDRNGFAWQAIAGLAYPLDFLCSCGYTVDATVEYRYFKPQARRVNHNTLSFGLRTNF